MNHFTSLLMYLLLLELTGCHAQMMKATRRLRTQRDDSTSVEGYPSLADSIISNLLLRYRGAEQRDAFTYEEEQHRQLGIGFDSDSPSSAPTSMDSDIDMSMSYNMSMSFSMPMMTASPTKSPKTAVPTSSSMTAAPATATPTNSPTMSPVTASPTTTEPIDTSPTDAPITSSPISAPTLSPSAPVPVTSAPVTSGPTLMQPPFVVTPPDVTCVDSSTWTQTFFDDFEQSFGAFEPTGPGVMRVPSELFAYEGVWSVRLVGNETTADRLYTASSISIESSSRVQLTFFYLPNEILDFPESVPKGLTVEFMLHNDGVWMLGKELVVGKDFVNDNTVWNFYCLQIDLPAGPKEISFRFFVNGNFATDQVFVDNVSLLVE